jgi:membrane-associated phospholipid phosphatase
MAEQKQSVWAQFRQRAEAIEQQPAMDPRSRPLYIGILAAFVIEGIVILASDFTMSANVLLKIFIALIWIAAAGLVFRRYGSKKVSGMLEAFALPPIVGALTAMSTVLLSAVSLPFADELLNRADKAIGFDWLALFSLYQRHGWLLWLSDWAYSSIYLQLAVISVMLFATGRSDRGWTFMTAWAVASLFTVLVYPFFPAEGPYVLYGITPKDIPDFHVTFPWATGPIIEGVRDGSIRDLARAMTGLVSFPSFHFAAAVLFAWAMLPVSWARNFFVVLNMAMGFATIIIGSHYLIDLFAGTLVAILSIWIAAKLVRWAGG